MDRFHCGKILLAFGRGCGVCGLDLDPNAPLDDDGEDFNNARYASLDVAIVEPGDDLPECADLDLPSAVRRAAAEALEAVNVGRRTKAVAFIGGGHAPIKAGTRVLHVHDRSYMWRFSLELYVQSAESAKRARENQRALKSWGKKRGRRPEVARPLVFFHGDRP